MKDIDLNLCTHLIYCWAKIDCENYKLKIRSVDIDIKQKGYEKFVALKMKNPKWKVMISVDGFSGEDKYTQLMTNNSNIDAFVESNVAFLQQYKFDGLDGFWNIDGFGVNLVVELKKAFRPHGYLLSALGSQFKDEIEKVKYIFFIYLIILI